MAVRRRCRPTYVGAAGCAPKSSKRKLRALRTAPGGLLPRLLLHLRRLKQRRKRRHRPPNAPALWLAPTACAMAPMACTNTVACANAVACANPWTPWPASTPCRAPILGTVPPSRAHGLRQPHDATDPMGLRPDGDTIIGPMTPDGLR